MKVFVAVCVILASALIGTDAQNLAVGVEISALAEEAAALTCTKSGAECAPDCSTLMICMASNPTPLDSVLCSSPNQYCVNGACTTKPTDQCTGAPSYTCTEDAVFPEPSDCTRYRVCEGGVSKLFQCETGFVFNSQLNVCQKGIIPCSKIDCSKATAINPYIVYASNPNFYAYCMNSNGNIRTIMFKCGDSEIFDTTLKACRFNCKARGYFQNPKSCNEYYYCSAALAKPSDVLLCPTNYVFDGTGCNKDATKCQFPPPVDTAAPVDPEAPA